MTTLTKRAQLTGIKRFTLARDITARYVAGASVRDLADHHGRSYGFVHRIVFESGTPMRNRRGSRRLAGRSRGVTHHQRDLMPCACAGANRHRT